MSIRRSPRLVAGIALAAAIPAAPTSAEVIYSNRVQTLVQGFGLIIDANETDSTVEVPTLPQGESDARLGDSITFGGSDRFVTSFATRLYRFGGVTGVTITADVELSLYQNDAGLPGALIWSGTREGVVVDHGSFSATDVVFSPNVLVPDSICFALALRNVIGNTRTPALGIVLSSADSPSAVGSSPNTFLLQDSASLAWRAVDESATSPHFRHVEAVVNAIPAPSTLAPLLAALPLAARRRRRAH